MSQETVPPAHGSLLNGKRLTSCPDVPGHLVTEGTTTQQTASPTHIRSTNGQYITRPTHSPNYIFANSASYLNSPNHFFISIVLSLPNRKPIHTYALVDSGATTSCISERFAAR